AAPRLDRRRADLAWRRHLAIPHALDWPLLLLALDRRAILRSAVRGSLVPPRVRRLPLTNRGPRVRPPTLRWLLLPDTRGRLLLLGLSRRLALRLLCLLL